MNFAVTGMSLKDQPLGVLIEDVKYKDGIATAVIKVTADAKPVEVFFPLREDVERMALAQYFCELALHMTPTDAPAPQHLRLLLAGLHYLCQPDRDPLQIKAVVEGRLLCLEGYMPDLTACTGCGCQPTGTCWFSPVAGTVFCDTCVKDGDAISLSSGVLAALRHILMGEFERCFAFRLPPSDIAVLATVMERFLLCQQSRRYATLDFYHTLRR